MRIVSGRFQIFNSQFTFFFYLYLKYMFIRKVMFLLTGPSVAAKLIKMMLMARCCSCSSPGWSSSTRGRGTSTPSTRWAQGWISHIKLVSVKSDGFWSEASAVCAAAAWRNRWDADVVPPAERPRSLFLHQRRSCSRRQFVLFNFLLLNFKWDV